MDRDQWQRVKKIFFEARDLSGPARLKFLDESCESVEIREAVEAQLNLKAPTEFMRAPAYGDAQGRVDLRPGDHFDRYEIIRLLGQGGMGTVYQAHDLELDRMVALKMIRPDLAGQAQILQRFKQELLFSQRVTHPNVVRIYDMGVAGEVRFITMEYVTGRELSALLKEKGKLPPAEAAGIISQVCHGLAAAHSAGIVHRDLKPANIMIDFKGRALIMDFGIAHSMEAALTLRVDSTQTMSDSTGKDAGMEGSATETGDSPSITRPGTLIGTPSYMSPEQASRRRVDQRSDIFTVGVILYTLISGANPSSGDSVSQVLTQRSVEPIRPIDEVEPGVPPVLSQIIMKCLELHPAKRYQTAMELAAALDDWEHGAPKPEFWTRRNILLAAGVAVGSVTVYAVWPPSQPKGPARIIKVLVSDFVNKTGNALLDGALEPMASLYLEDAAFISLFDRKDARRTLVQLNGSPAMNLETGRMLAQREGVGILISGTLAKVDDGLSLTLSAIDAATGKVVSSSSDTVDSAEKLPRSLSGAVAQIRRQLGDVTPVAAQIAAAETFTSPSMEASAEYAQAQEFLWKGDPDNALLAYDRALQKDPELGRAYAGKAAVLANVGNRQEAEEQYRLALARIERMSGREKFRTRGSYYLFRRDYDRAVEQFKSLSEQYPADTAAIGNLALSYFYQRNMAAAVKEGARAVAAYPSNVLQLNNQMLFEMYAGNFEGAVKEAQKVLALNDSYHKSFVGLGLSNLALGNREDAVAAYQKLAKLGTRGASMAALATADMALYEGRFDDAVAILKPSIKADEVAKDKGTRAAMKWIALAEAQFSLGKKREAALAAEQAVALFADDPILFSAGNTYLKTGLEARALGVTALIASHFGPEPQAMTKLLDGERLLLRASYRSAIDSFQSAQKIADTWLGRFGLGRALLGVNAFPEAEAQFDACLQRRGEATAVFLDEEPSFRYFPPVYYYLGRAQQGLASKGAVEHYKTFVKIKEKSQPDALVQDARKRLAAIAR